MAKKDKPPYDPKAPRQCQHQNKVITTNRKGRQFWECQRCGAFLGWV